MTRCAWCVVAPALPDGRYCSKRCRQTAYRQRKAGGVKVNASLSAEEARAATPQTFEIADPPYPGFAWMYKDQPSYAGEVDHAALVARLRADYVAGRLNGFALCTSSKTLFQVAPYFAGLAFPELRIGGWFKPRGVPETTKGSESTWEPLVVVGGRRMAPGFRDWIEAPALKTPAARGGDSDLIGRKPQLFAAWAFDMLGMLPGDTLIDTFPGSGIITAAWRELSSRAARQLSLSLDAGTERRVVLSSLGAAAETAP